MKRSKLDRIIRAPRGDRPTRGEAREGRLGDGRKEGRKEGRKQDGLIDGSGYQKWKVTDSPRGAAKFGEFYIVGGRGDSILRSMCVWSSFNRNTLLGVFSAERGDDSGSDPAALATDWRKLH